MAKELPVLGAPRGYALVDDNVYAVLSQHEWRVNTCDTCSGLRPFTLERTGRDKWPHKVLLAHALMRAEKGQFVQHRNGDTFDCRRENLRIVSSAGEAVRTTQLRDKLLMHPELVSKAELEEIGCEFSCPESMFQKSFR